MFDPRTGADPKGKFLRFAMVAHLTLVQYIQGNGGTRSVMDPLRRLCAFSLLLLAVLAGCTPRQNPQDLKEKTAQTTAELKRDAKAVAAGIREGWNRDNPVDLNSATKEQLLTLPGLTPAQADRIIADRPYKEPGELVTRHILTKTEYDQISGRIKTSK